MSHMLSGRVVSGNGRTACVDASVAIVGGPASAPDLAALTDDQGRFSLTDLPAGRWRVRAISIDGAEAIVDVVLPQLQEVLIVLEDRWSTDEA